MRCRICGCEQNSTICKFAPNMKVLGSGYPDCASYLVSCDNCGNVFADVPITQDIVTQYYQSESAVALSYYEVYGEKHADEYFSCILDNIKQYISYDSNILDVASGVGDFSVFMKKSGYKRITALDCSGRCIAHLQERGIEALQSDTLTPFADRLKTFDLAVFIHSLEHYLDYDKAIMTVMEMLKDDGFIYIEVPDTENYCNESDAPYTMFTYEHLVHFSLAAFSNIARAFGLKLVTKGRFYKADSYHVIYCVFQKGGTRSKVVKDDSARKAIMAYNQLSAERLKILIAPFEKSQEPLILWGIGASTASMLDGHFDKCNVHGLVDRNQARQGLSFELSGRQMKVMSPEMIDEERATIVVLPFWYKDSIIRQIKEMGLKNKVVALS